MQTWCERQGQVEIGVIEHEGNTFAALGATVVGRHVTGYTCLQPNGNIDLKTWCGQTMLSCRSKVVEEYHDGSLAMVFRLPRARFVVGYALAESGMLFRGELLTGCTDDEARDEARRLSEYWAERDAEDEEAWEGAA
jgi:hypothetical protein